MGRMRRKDTVSKRNETAYTPKQRIALTMHSTIRADAALTLGEDSFTHEFLVLNGLRAPLLCAAGISPTQLHAHGTDSPEKLAAVGFSSLHLTRPGFCEELVRLYGADPVVEAFLLGSDDAATLAGERCLATLGVDTALLLMLCAGRPESSMAVVRAADSLVGVPPQTLVMSGVTAAQLKSAGYTVETLKNQTGISGLEILSLGAESI